MDKKYYYDDPNFPIFPTQNTTITNYNDQLPSTSNNYVNPNLPSTSYNYVNSVEVMNDDEYFNRMPRGYRFLPTDEELIVHYLLKKVNNQMLPRNKINEVKFYAFDPDTLAVNFKAAVENTWYFFSSRKKKYRCGTRPARAAGEGYWKATGAGKTIEYNGEVVGYKTSLSYLHGKPPKGTKTNWLMNELTVKDLPSSAQTPQDGMALDGYVLCKLYKNRRNTNKKEAANKEEEDMHDINSTVEYESKRRCIPF